MKAEGLAPVVYQDVQITYDEDRNEWLFELRGRDRSADSLAKAKEFIDRPVKEKSAFQKFRAYIASGWDGKYSTVEVTSVAESGWGSGQYFWISNDGKRSKENGDSLYVINEKNERLIARIMVLRKEIKVREAECSSAQYELDKVSVPKEETA